MKKMEKVNVALIFDILTELREGNDRSLAIVGAALVESSLDYLIKNYLVNDESKVDKFINGKDFYSKIQLAYFLGLISKDEYNDLNCIREIRNLFAHKLSVSDLNDKDVKSESSKFIIPKKMNYKNDNLREMLLITYVLLFFQLQWRCRKIKQLKILEDDGYEKIKNSLEKFALKFGEFFNSIGAFYRKTFEKNN